MSDLLDFNSAISKEEFNEIIPEGTYKFSVIQHKIKMIDSGKMQGAKKMSIMLRLVGDGDQEYRAWDDLVLHKRLAWKLWQFWDSVVRIEDESNFVPPWGQIDSCHGEVEVKITQYLSKKDNKKYDQNVFSYVSYAKQNHRVDDQDVNMDDIPF